MSAATDATDTRVAQLRAIAERMRAEAAADPTVEAEDLSAMRAVEGAAEWRSKNSRWRQ